MASIAKNWNVPSPHLSVAIPTFNRRAELIECLSSIIPQAQKHGVRIYVSDNASDYDAASLIDEFRIRYPLISFQRNPANVGLDANVRGVMSMVASEYVWVFSDDDTMADGALDRVMPLCESGEYTLILPERELRSQDMSRPLGAPSHNEVTEPTECDDPVELFERYGFWHYTFIGSLIVKISDWNRVDKEKYTSCLWFEHLCRLAETMQERKALVLPDPLINARCGTSSYESIWWSVWVHYLPAALTALPELYPLACRRQVLSDLVRTSGQSPLRFMLNGRAIGSLSWGKGRFILGPFVQLRAVAWLLAGGVALVIPRFLCAWLRRIMLKGAS